MENSGANDWGKQVIAGLLVTVGRIGIGGSSAGLLDIFLDVLSVYVDLKLIFSAPDRSASAFCQKIFNSSFSTFQKLLFASCQLNGL